MARSRRHARDEIKMVEGFKKRGTLHEFEMKCFAPYYPPKPRPDKIVDMYSKREPGQPGTIDANGVLIPVNILSNRKVKTKKVEVEEEPGKIKVAMMRSFYSGRRYFSRRSLKIADKILRRIETDSSFAIRVLDRKGISPEMYKAIGKYNSYMHKMGFRKKQSLGNTEGYLTVDGVRCVKKVLKPRKDALNNTPITGVVRKEL